MPFLVKTSKDNTMNKKTTNHKDEFLVFQKMGGRLYSLELLQHRILVYFMLKKLSLEMAIYRSNTEKYKSTPNSWVQINFK